MRALTLWILVAWVAAIPTTGRVDEGMENGREGVDDSGGGDAGAQRSIPSRLPESPPSESLQAPINQLLACVCLFNSDPDERAKERENIIHRAFRENKPKISILPGGTTYEYQFQRYIYRELNERCIPSFWKTDGWARAGLYSNFKPPMEIEKKAFAQRFPLRRPDLNDKMLKEMLRKHKRKQRITGVLRGLNEELTACLCRNKMFQTPALPSLRSRPTYSEKTQELKVNIKMGMLDRATQKVNEAKYNEQKKCLEEHQARVKAAIDGLRRHSGMKPPGITPSRRPNAEPHPAAEKVKDVIGNGVRRFADSVGETSKTAVDNLGRILNTVPKPAPGHFIDPAPGPAPLYWRS